jgi:uncharacterized metal-binding protein
MASGKVHDRASVLFGALAMIPVMAVLQAAYDPSDVLIGGVATFCGGMLAQVINPDLDIDGITRAERNLLNLFTPLGVMWVAFWTPYALALPHRSLWSHFPVLGTVIRVGYMLVGWVTFRLSSLEWGWSALMSMVLYWLMSKLIVMLVLSGIAFLVWFSVLAKARMLEQVIMFGLLAGLCSADISHWLLDGMPI